MGIGTKDRQILWSRGMGKCSICRKQLILVAPGASSGSTLVGENCHIVGEKHDAPRGNSVLSNEDRNRYPNLILLCREHHKVVDDDPTTYPIEKLHLIKSDHELWVANLVPSENDDVVRNLYSFKVNLITERLLLEKWPWFTDCAVRELVPSDFVDGVREVGIEVRKTVWPQKYLELEAAIQNLDKRATAYVDTFLELAYKDPTGWFRYDSRKLDIKRINLDALVNNRKNWEHRCNQTLWNLTFSLNQYAAAVRSNMNSTYFLIQGAFYINDSLGVSNSMEGVAYFPDKYLK